MSIRTYTRILFNGVFRNNFVIEIISKIVNFYCSLPFTPSNSIKFEQNIPMINMEEKRKIFFQSVTGDKIDCK